MEDITDADYMQAKRVCKDFEIKEYGEYDDLHVQGDALLLAAVFNNLQNICVEVYWLDPEHFRSAPGVACQAALKS